MTKKHFIALADTVRELQPREGVHHEAAFAQWEMTKTVLADFCASHNPNFNRERWLAYIAGECGPSGGAIKS